jgi:hypothetical protein
MIIAWELLRNLGKCDEVQVRTFEQKTKNENGIQDGNKNRLNSGNVCCCSVKNFLFLRLLFTKLRFKIHKHYNFAGYFTSLIFAPSLFRKMYFEVV